MEKDLLQAFHIEELPPWPGMPESSFRVFHLPQEGPPVVVMHELPGMVPECLEFALRLKEEGFAVYLPLLFGEVGGHYSPPAALYKLYCIRREMQLLADGSGSPLTHWLRSLCRHVHEKHGGPGVGAIGMCLTGEFVIPLLVEPAVVAPVMSQPAFPMEALRRFGIGISPDEVAKARQRAGEGIPIQAFRFSHDWLSPRSKVRKYQALFPGSFSIRQLSQKGQGRLLCHSVFTLHFKGKGGSPTEATQAAYDQLIAFFRERLS